MAKTFPSPSSENENVSIRKIDNGYIMSCSKYGPKGYESHETFSQEKPKIELGQPPKHRAKPRSNLAKAIGHAKGKSK